MELTRAVMCMRGAASARMAVLLMIPGTSSATVYTTVVGLGDTYRMYGKKPLT